MIVDQQYTNYVSPLEKSSMSSYPNLLTPPSSSEDSPHSYLVASPNSNTFEYENYDFSPMQVQGSFVKPILEPNIMIDPNLIKPESQPQPSLEFIEQPTDRFRFRYKSEMAGTHGSLTGMNSDKSRKPTYPTVQLHNCTGRVIVRCSIYQVNCEGKDFLPHAHRLIMKKGKDEHDDPHDIVIGPEDGYRAVFQGMGIIHTAKKNIVSELTRKKMQLKKEFVARAEGKIRELTQKEVIEIKGLAESESKSINLNIVCLRFDAFIQESNGILYRICEPIFSHGINNLKSALTGDLKIVRLDHVVSPAKGGKEIFILVERVTKKNIKIRLYELDDEDKVIWEDWGKFNDLDVHHQYAIVFKTPKYRDENITSPVSVFIELVRPSDNARSEPRDFRYIPNKPAIKPGQKRARYDDYSYSSSYNSSLGSDELPVPINNLQIEQNTNVVEENNPFSNAPSVISEELRRAMDNINSDEFQKIFSVYGEEFFKSSVYDTMDTSITTDNVQMRPRGKKDTMVSHLPKPDHTIKMEVTREERVMAIKVVEELRNFVKTTHKKEIAIRMLKYYFGEEQKTNALHVSICQKDNDSAMLLLKVMAYYEQFDLLEISNNDKQTPLHLAVLCFNHTMVKCILMCRAHVSTTDNELNTALHLAIKSGAPLEILEMLLTNRKCEGIHDYIDLENEQGNSALMVAVEKKKLAAVKLLCMKGADINKKHPKNGFVPLRVAIEKKHADIVKYFLLLSHLDATAKDFQNISPLTAAFGKDDVDAEITKSLQNYMKSKNIILEVKEEPEDDSDSEMEIDVTEVDEELSEVKPELPHLTPEELEKLYEGVSVFTPECLDEVAAILDKTENWKCLAELLEIEHLITSGMITTELSMSKAVLRHSIETSHDSVLMIRNFLENLDEFSAVEAIDRMVFEMKKR